MKNILMAASEAFPFIKTGGLADVVGSLPKYLDKKYYDCRIVLPKYACMRQEMKDRMEYVTHFYMNYNGRDRYVGIMQAEYDGVQYYFIDNEEYFSGPSPYGDWLWDIEKFIFFDQAVLSILPVIGFRPDVIHCHDWQTGLIPVYIHDKFAGGDFYRGIKTVMTIHNLKFQGCWGIRDFQRLSGLSNYYFTPDKLECNKDGNMLKGGIVYADAVTTVSCTYANEIQTPFYGEGLDGILSARRNDLRGILNGIDYEVFDPDNDSLISTNYSDTNFRTRKVRNKTALQKELGLEVNPKKFMAAVVSRLTAQKGFDLVQRVIEEITTEDVQLVVLGTGEAGFENTFNYFAWKYPQRVSSNIFYSEELSHKIYAASDAFLMPSAFEPCGLSQLMALRYGSVPIVRETGGLKDTVEAYNEFENTGTGFSFANYNAHEMLFTLQYAKRVYYEKRRSWNNIAERAMKQDFSWDASALKYQELYDWLTR
ncbi:MAG: glycogen synthase GlgA [Lachnospiraceae bacterium]|nr:glycogen synthase GlgA [Candidatus Darwinimomas equi]